MPADDAGMAKRTGKPTTTTPPTRPSRAFYPNKENGERVQGVLSATGGVTFNTLRASLGRCSGRDFERVSDADVIEYAVTVTVHGVIHASRELQRNGIIK